MEALMDTQLDWEAILEAALQSQAARQSWESEEIPAVSVPTERGGLEGGRGAGTFSGPFAQNRAFASTGSTES